MMEILKSTLSLVILVGSICTVVTMFSILPPMEKDVVNYSTPEAAIAANFR